MLLAQCDSQLVCSEVKLALLESLPPDHDVTVLQRLGLPDERVFTVAYVVRAVSQGHYVMPQAKVEDMYRPNRYARTKTGVLDIQPPAR